MAINYLNSIDLNRNELQNAQLIKSQVENQPNDAAVGGTPVEGQLYFNTSDDVLKVYANGSWAEVGGGVISLTAGRYLTNSGTAADPTIDHDLTTRTDSTTVETLTYGGTFAAYTDVTTNATGHVTGSEETTFTMPSAYTFDVTADSGTDQTISSGNTLDIAGGTNITTVVGNADTVTVNLDDSITLAGELTVNGTGQSSFAGQVTIPQTPAVDTDAASKHYVDQAVTGALSYQGGYNAATNTPDLDSSPSSSIKTGFTYTVTADGLFFTEQVRVGDVLIAEIDSPTTLADWTTVQNNIDLSDLTTVGLGNVNAGDGISVAYSNGTATVTNTQKNSDNTFEYTIPSGATSSAQIHTLNTRDVIVQLYDKVTYETVYADVERFAVNQIIVTFGAPITNDIKVLVQKIG